MKRLSTLLLCLIFLSCSPNYSTLNLQPMYGGVEKNDYLKHMDKTFVLEATAKYGSRDSASKVYANIGWSYMRQNKLDMAMKRFNQSWLLDSTNAESYWGFANLNSMKNGSFDSALYFYDKAKNLLGYNERLIGDIASSYAEKAFDLKNQSDSTWISFYQQSMSYFSTLTTRNKENCDIYLTYWNIALEFDDATNVSKAMKIIDEIGILPHNNERYKFIWEKTKQ